MLFKYLPTLGKAGHADINLHAIAAVIEKDTHYRIHMQSDLCIDISKETYHQDLEPHLYPEDK